MTTADPPGQLGPGGSHKASTDSTLRGLLAVPAPIKRIFDSVPLTTYAANASPVGALHARDSNVLLVLATPEDAASGTPSYDPSCLKWQTLLRIYDVSFQTASVSRHSAAGARLPLLVPASTSTSPDSRTVVPPSALASWIRTHSEEPARTPINPLHEALLSPIRDALQYLFYTTPALQKSVPLQRIQGQNASGSPVLEEALTWLASCDTYEAITRDSGAVMPKIDEEALCSEADEALEALSTLLGEDQWFGRRKDNNKGGLDDGAGVESEQIPGMLDASVFSCTHTALKYLDDGAATSHSIRKHDNLVQHHDRIVELFFA